MFYSVLTKSSEGAWWFGNVFDCINWNLKIDIWYNGIFQFVVVCFRFVIHYLRSDQIRFPEILRSRMQCYWPFVWGIDRLLVDYQHKEPVMLSFDGCFLLAWISFWTNNQVGSEMICLNAHVKILWQRDCHHVWIFSLHFWHFGYVIFI